MVGEPRLMSGNADVKSHTRPRRRHARGWRAWSAGGVASALNRAASSERSAGSTVAGGHAVAIDTLRCYNLDRHFVNTQAQSRRRISCIVEPLKPAPKHKRLWQPSSRPGHRLNSPALSRIRRPSWRVRHVKRRSRQRGESVMPFDMNRHDAHVHMGSAGPPPAAGVESVRLK